MKSNESETDEVVLKGAERWIKRREIIVSWRENYLKITKPITRKFFLRLIHDQCVDDGLG